MPVMEESWQQWLEQEARKRGLIVSSGYRTVEDQRRLGSSLNSYHTRGTRERPGAMDIAGPAEALTQLFQDIKQQFKGAINELFLNIPGGQSSAIKNNAYLGRNPEAGRPKHLHVALGAATAPPPAAGIPAEQRGDRALAAAPADACARSISWTTPAAWVAVALGKDAPEGSTHQLCWSDVWFYGVGVALLTVGVGMLKASGGK